MPQRLLTATTLLLILTVRTAGAQCPFEHPRSARNLKGSLVQAFDPCTGVNGQDYSNTTTEGGVPACYPAETFDENAGSPSNGWHWGPNGSGTLDLKTVAGDVAITLRLHDVREGSGGLVETSGKLLMLLRMTVADPGPMTIIDYPLQIPVALVHGKATFKTTLLTMLHGLNPAFVLPPCSNIEVLELLVRDVNSNPFAKVGTFLP